MLKSDIIKKLEIKHENLKAQVTVCEQLAYSACLRNNKWQPALCPSRYQESRSSSFGDALFNINGEVIDYDSWSDDNKECWTPMGGVARFPTPPFTKKSASLIITPYADNRRVNYLKQYHI